MIEIKDLLNINYYNYGQCFTGSEKGMRYRVAREPLINVFRASEEEKNIEPKLKVTVWSEPYCYEKTDDELKTDNYFEFSTEGINSAVSWLNEIYKKKFETLV
jgi:hypothetical protein